MDLWWAYNLVSTSPLPWHLKLVGSWRNINYTMFFFIWNKIVLVTCRLPEFHIWRLDTDLDTDFGLILSMWRKLILNIIIIKISTLMSKYLFFNLSILPMYYWWNQRPILYMSQAIEEIRHFQKCLGNWGISGID